MKIKPEMLERTVPGLHASLALKISKYSKDINVLDVGCGTGAWLNRLKNEGYTNLVGVDQNTKQFVPEEIKSIEADFDIDEICLSEGPFELISAIEIIEHLSNIGKFLSFIEKNLKQNGRVLVSTPNVNSVACGMKYLVKKELRHFDAHGDSTHISPIFLYPFKSLLSSYGFEIDELWTYPESATTFGSSNTTSFVISVISKIVSDPYPGDVLCMTIKRVSDK